MSSQQFTRANAECTAALRVEWKPGKLSLNTWAVSQYSSCRLSGFTGLSQSPSNADSSVVLAHKSLRTFLHALHWSADSHSGFEQLFSLRRHGSQVLTDFKARLLLEILLWLYGPEKFPGAFENRAFRTSFDYFRSQLEESRGTSAAVQPTETPVIYKTLLAQLTCMQTTPTTQQTRIIVNWWPRYWGFWILVNRMNIPQTRDEI